MRSELTMRARDSGDSERYLRYSLFRGFKSIRDLVGTNRQFYFAAIYLTLKVLERSNPSLMRAVRNRLGMRSTYTYAGFCFGGSKISDRVMAKLLTPSRQTPLAVG